MAQMGRPGLSPQQKHELWARWKAGQSLSDIGVVLVGMPDQSSVCCFHGAVLHLRRERGLHGRCPCTNGKRYPVD
jgi:hypothetical protein